MPATPPDPDRRFRVAHEKARADWAAADPALAAAKAGCVYSSEGVLVPFFGMPYRITHPAGEVVSLGAPAGGTERPAVAAHPAVAIALLHYLLTADGTRPADRWVTFRELPDGLFYAQAFANHAEGLLAARYGADVEGFRRAAAKLGGTPLSLADASFRFQALPRVAMAALIWAEDEEFPAQARILYDAAAGHYLPTEDLSGIGDWLAHRLVRG